MERPSGWFDDPDDDSQLRYFDGVVWTQHTAPKRPVAPAAYDARLQGGADGPVGYGAASPHGGYGGPHPTAQYGYVAGQHPFDASASRHARRGDARLSGWWRRVAAYLVDSFLVGIVSSLLTWTRSVQAYDALASWTSQTVEAAADGRSTAGAVLPERLVTDLAFLGVVQLVVFFVYEVGLLTWLGATPGRMLVRCRVVAAKGGPLTFFAVLRRTVVKSISNLFSAVPLLSYVVGVFQLIDFLWPLWDERNQALHDKAGDTVVVVAPTRRSTAAPADPARRRRARRQG